MLLHLGRPISPITFRPTAQKLLLSDSDGHVLRYPSPPNSPRFISYFATALSFVGVVVIIQWLSSLYLFRSIWCDELLTVSFCWTPASESIRKPCSVSSATPANQRVYLVPDPTVLQQQDPLVHGHILRPVVVVGKRGQGWLA